MANWYVSSVAYAAVSVWTALTTLSVGAFRRQVSPTVGNERVFKVTSITTGTTGASEPTWNLNNNATTTDAGVTWTQVSGQETSQSAGNWTAPIARLTMFPSGSNAIGGAGFLTTGDTIFVSSDHNETTPTGSITLSLVAGVDNVRILSVSRTGASLPPTSTDLLRGASIALQTAGSTLTVATGTSYIWGIDIKANGGISVQQNGGESSDYDNCSFQQTRNAADLLFINAAGFIGTIIWTNTPVFFANAGQNIQLNNGQFEWRNTPSAVQGAAVPTNLLTPQSNAAKVFFHGLDLSSVTTNIFATSSGTPYNDMRMRDCKLANGATICGSTNSGWNVLAKGTSQIMVDNCDDTTNGRNYRMFRTNGWGAVQQNIALVRSGGNTDGTTQFSWQAIFSQAPVAPSTFGNPARFPEIAQRYNTTGSSKTLTLYGISSFSSIPTNANLWIDVEYLGSSASPLASLITSRSADALAAATNLTADTSDWTTNITSRANSHAYSIGDLIKVPDNTGRVFICTVSGTSAGSEPGGYASAVDGGSVTDSGATFRAIWRYKMTVTFTPNMAGTVKCVVKTLLNVSQTPTVNLLIIDPAFTLT